MSLTYKQIQPFNQSLAGTEPLFCLKNVRLGYSIPAKYPNAITAWKNTEQHTNRNVPTGVDVPLYYTYKTDGHINVRLANGKVWSDGEIFTSIADYEAKREPNFIGWGESVNDVRVIKEEEEDMLSKDQLVDLWVAFKGRGPTEAEREKYIGKTKYADLRADLLASDAFKAKIKASAAGELNPVQHLTTPLKKAYVAPDYEPVDETLYRKKGV